MTRLTDERIASLARQYLGTCKRVFYTKWKDGIDIEYPTLEVEQFARAIEAELSKQEPVAWQERQRLSYNGAWTNWYECSHRPIDAPRQSLLGGEGGIPIEWRPLYTAPPPSAPDTVQVPRKWSDDDAVRVAHAAGFSGTCWTVGPEELSHLLNMIAVAPKSTP